jgi:tetratricopeptide (TPR) repeat protein
LAYGKKGEYDKAIKDCTQAIRLKPDYAYAFNNRGLAYRKKGETNKAIKDLSEAIRLKPDDALAYYNRGLAYEERGETNKAIKDYTEAIRLDPDSEWSNDLERKAKSKAALPNRSDLSTITNPDEKAAALAFKAAGANLFLTNGTVTDIGFLGGGCDDALAANLAKTPYVERLTLLGCPKVTDKSVAAISGLKKLKMAMLIGTGISAVGAKKIQRAVGRGGMVMHPATQRSMMKALGGGGPGGQ